METNTAIYVILIFVASLGFSFFVGYKTGYLRYSCLYEKDLDTLTKLVKGENSNGDETLRTQDKNKDII